MYWFNNIYYFFYTFFDIFSFRTKQNQLRLNDIENPDFLDYAVIYDNNKMNI